MTVKERLHHLIEYLPENELHAAQRYLEYLHDQGDPFLRALANAPEDEEEETPEERAAVLEAADDIAAGRLIPHEEVRRRLLSDS